MIAEIKFEKLNCFESIKIISNAKTATRIRGQRGWRKNIDCIVLSKIKLIQTQINYETKSNGNIIIETNKKKFKERMEFGNVYRQYTV